MLRLAKYLKHFKMQATIGPFFKLLDSIFELIIPLVMAQIIDVGVKNGDESYVYKMGAIMIALGFAGFCFSLICQYSAAVASQGTGTMIRNDLFKHINELSHAEVDAIGTNSLITRMTNDVNQIQLAVAMLIRLMIRAPFLIIGSTVMAMIINIRLSLIFFVMAFLVSVVLYLVMSRSIPFYRMIQKKLDKVSFITRENLIGTRVIRAFSKQDNEKDRFGEASDEVAEAAMRVGKLSALLNPLNFVILNLAVIAIIWFGGHSVYNGELTQGQIIALVSYMTQIFTTLVIIANLVVIFTKAGASAARINEVFDLKPSFQHKNPAKRVSCGSGGGPGDSKLSLENVSFSYPDSPELVLKHIDLEIHAGETIGIIGGTGSGKSTLIQLLPRFYDITEGTILVDGINIKDYDLGDLRYKFGIVPQKAVLFSGTILENLRWGNETLTEEEAFRAIETAQAKEFVDQLEDGLSHYIVQGAKNLSGGQKQRLAIARAVARKPEILVLDDSFSALDYVTDFKLRSEIYTMSNKSEPPMTVIFVTQRCNTIKNADQIIVMDEGEVVGIGKHEALMESCPVYEEICLSQLKTEEVYANA